MQIGSSLLAAHEAAREAQARFQAAHAAPAAAKPQSAAGTDAFQPLPLKQAAAQPQANARPGSLLDIKV